MSEATVVTEPGDAVSAAPSGAPVPPRGRIDLLDALRGLALFGTLIAARPGGSPR